MGVDIASFIHEYFIRPMIDSSVPGYNMINTLTYGAILMGAAFYVIYPFLKKKEMRFDWEFLKTLLPYILFGISLRVLEDLKILARSPSPLDPGFYIFTPGIWILTFILVMIGMFIGKWIEKKTKYSAPTAMFYFGILISAPLLLFHILNAIEWGGVIAVVGIAGVICTIVFFLAKKVNWDFLDTPLAKAAFLGQVLDTSATFVALEFFQCGEQHVLPRLLFGAFGNISFFFIKIPLVLLILYWLHKEYQKEDPHLHGFILLFLAILGLATGGRDALTVWMGTCSP
jgi:uncharacterized membrane protein